MRLAILAFGSLVDNPGEDLAPVIVERQWGALTPFHVEFAHASALRDGAPTLAPVTSGGATVEAVLLILRDSLSIEAACDFLYARETGRPGSGAQYDPDPNKPNQVYIEVLPFFLGLTTAIYTRTSSNITPLTADELARRAIASAWGPAGAADLDGIRYLINTKTHGIQTPLMADYERRILEMTHEPDLASARQHVRQAVAVANF